MDGMALVSDRSERLIDDNARRLSDTLPSSAGYSPHTFSACTLDEAVEAVGYGRYQRRLLVLTAFTQVADATELMLMSYLTSEAVWCTTPWSDVSGSRQLVSSCVFAGMLVGAAAIGWLSDAHGRRVGYVCALLLTGVGGLVAACAQSLSLLAAMRFCVGMGAGGAPAALSLFAEFLPVSRRGSHLILFLLFFSLGTLLEALLAWLTLPSAWGWRGLLALSSAPSLLLLLATPLLPESPRYHLLRQRPQRALRTLRGVARVNGRDAALEAVGHLKPLGGGGGGDAGDATPEPPPPPPRPPPSAGGVERASFAFGAARRAVVAGAEAAWRRVAALYGREMRATTLPLSALFFLMAYVYYGLVLLQPSLVNFTDGGGGGRHTNASAAAAADGSGGGGGGCADAVGIDYAGNVLIASGELPGLAAAALLLERAGRRRTIAGFFVATGALMLLLLLPLPSGVGLALLCLSRATALGFNQSLWVFAAELLPTAVRATGIGLVTCFARVAGLVATNTLTGLWDVSHAATMAVCAAGCGGAAALVCLLPHDTAGTSLRDTVGGGGKPVAAAPAPPSEAPAWGQGEGEAPALPELPEPEQGTYG